MPTAPPDLARGVAADYGMLVAALITVGLIMWRDRTSSPAWQTVTTGLLLALMIAWSGRLGQAREVVRWHATRATP
jgi:hypothetical protein